MKKRKPEAAAEYFPGDAQAYTLIDLFVEGIKILNDGELPIHDRWKKHLLKSLIASKRGRRKSQLVRETKIKVVNAAVKEKEDAQLDSRRPVLKDIVPKIDKGANPNVLTKKVNTKNVARDIRTYGEAAAKQRKTANTANERPSDKELIMAWMDSARQLGIRPSLPPEKSNIPKS